MATMGTIRGSTAAVLAAYCNIGKQVNPSLFLVPRNCRRIKFNLFASRPPLHGSISYPQNPQTGFRCRIRALHEAAVAPERQYEENPSQNWKIKMLYDGDCPLCMREVNMLRERNEQYGTIKFVDISSEKYSPQENQGLDYQTAMGRIHAILANGTVVTDVEAFRRLYEEVGLGWVYAITKYKPIAKIADVVYGAWAKYRLQITGRPPLEQIMEARKSKDRLCDDPKNCKM